jgi:hypothetical protein
MRCRGQVSSRRALRADPAFDKIVQTFYPDTDAYEAKEEQFISRVNAQSNSVADVVEEALRRQVRKKKKDLLRVLSPALKIFYVYLCSSSLSRLKSRGSCVFERERVCVCLSSASPASFSWEHRRAGRNKSGREELGAEKTRVTACSPRVQMKREQDWGAPIQVFCQSLFSSTLFFPSRASTPTPLSRGSSRQMQQVQEDIARTQPLLQLPRQRLPTMPSLGALRLSVLSVLVTHIYLYIYLYICI